jgi:SNF2 family DNA or RNA helicase
VLAPLRVCNEVWVQERDKWGIPVTMEVATGMESQRLKAIHGSAQIVVMNYEQIVWLTKQKHNFNGLVCDELTRLKDSSGKRFKALIKKIDCFKVRYGMTGSFTSNGLEDVFGQCKVIDQTLLGRYKTAFLDEYFVLTNPEYHAYSPRPESLDKVMKRIKGSTFVLENAVYKDKLPPLHTVFLDCEMSIQGKSSYKEMKKEHALTFDSKEVIAKNAAVVNSKLQQGASGFYYANGKEQVAVWVSHHKFDRLKELLEENQRDPTLVFYMFDAERQELLKRYPHAQTLDDHDAVNRWNRGEIELLIAHPKSASHGLNLQEYGNKIVFMSLPYSMDLFEQAVARVHRGGQKREVWCYIMQTKNTLEAGIWDVLVNKKDFSELAIEALK